MKEVERLDTEERLEKLEGEVFAEKRRTRWVLAAWVIGLPLLLSSCAGRLTPVFVKPDVTDLEATRDRHQCIQRASDYMVLPTTLGGLGMTGVSRQVYIACMEARGYKKQ